MHLKKEDKELYPKFKKAKQKELKELGHAFSHLMLKYSQDIQTTLSAIEKEGKISKKLAKELETVEDKLQDRLYVEEKILFEAYLKYFKDN